MSETNTAGENAFAAKMTDILNYGALNLAMAIGYRTRLFDVMDDFDAPASASAIAAATGLNTRYVEEWLGVMASGGVVELSRDEEGGDCFLLPAAHGDLLTRRADNNNLGVYTQEIPLLTTCAMEAVTEGFRTGRGVAYENYPRFQDFMGQLADAKHGRVLVSDFLPSVDDGRIVERMKRGVRVCDLGCAEGVALILMAEAFPASEFVGVDIAGEALEKARAMAEGLRNVSFINKDAAALARDSELADSFDYITAFDAIHDQTRPMEAMRGAYAILKPGGVFSMVDIAASSRLADNVDHPMGPFLYTVSLMHCMPVGLVDGGTGLGMMWGRQKAVGMLEEAGFTRVDVNEIPDDPFNLHFFCKKNR
ncbi:MAG: class I SAM-dependent methyltransferase [Desulfobacterales bacterium]|nr:class I SAM-dependent methyltransferase [Desulfobacterales bacterium]